jgi:hypothetical protein
MDNTAIKAAIETIELQLDALRAAAGLASDEDEGEADESDNKVKVERTLPRRRGRAKLMPRYKADDDGDA